MYPTFKNTCVFISSSDNTADIFELLKSNFEEKLSETGFRVFVGKNTRATPQSFELKLAPLSNWANELRIQLSKLDDRYKFVILLLDDFYIKEIDLNFMLDLRKFPWGSTPDYVRLSRLHTSVSYKIINWFRSKKSDTANFNKLQSAEPYYSSLQVALWRREYIIGRLTEPQTIWEFEHRVPLASSHFSSEVDYFKYIHLVEKGKWLYHAPKYLRLNRESVEFEERGFHSLGWIGDLLDRLKFAIFGFTFFRIRRLFNSRRLR